MNSAYRLIWNDRLGAWCVAPEIASARGKRSGGIKQCAATLLLTLAVGSHVVSAADLAATALPGGGQVTAGQASISSTGAAMTINQGSQRAIINWQNFDIGSQASVSFRQPDASAVALNRVSGPTASRIEGQLSANGQVFLVNPNGVLFGNGARVNVGGLVASTLAIRDDDFLSGNYVFNGSGGSITNHGQIAAAPGGYLAFIAPNITNNGTLNAPQGTVAMGAGERVRLNFSGDRLVGMDVSAATIDTLITNSQAIRAEGGAILLTAAGAEAVTRGVINNNGVLEASSLTSDGGRIALTAGSDINLGAGSLVAVDGQKGGKIEIQAAAGTLLADGQVTARGNSGAGGAIQLLGNQVGLVNAVEVDASGTTGGGTINIGGSQQGAGPLPNSRAVYIGADAQVNASATANGDGGTIIVYADEAARIYGYLSARGGAQGGNGGFIETSGKQYLDLLRTPDATAVAGRGGQWLIDPNNILIVSTVGTCTNLSGCTAGPTWATTNDSAQLGVNLINAALNGGQSVTITTTASGTNTQPGNITFQSGANISKTAGADASLTLSAHNDINTTGATIGAIAGRLNVVLTADSDNSGVGNVVIGSAVTTRGGSFTATGASISGAGALSTVGGANGDGGNVNLSASTGNLNVGAITTTGGAATGSAGRNAGNVTINSAGAVTTAAITANGNAGNGTDQAGGNGGAIAITGVGGITTAALAASGGAAAATNGKGGDSGSITLNNSGSGNISSTTLTARAGAGTGIGAGGNVGSIALTNSAAGGNISTTTISTLGTNNSGGGDVLLSSQGNVTVTGSIGTSAGTNSSLGAGKKAGNIIITGVNRSVTSGISANGGIASGTNQAGGSAGIVSITGSGTLSTLGINSRTGTATGSGAGGTVGGITLTGSNITTGGLLDTSGRENGDGGNININATGLLTLNGGTTGALLSSGGANVTGTTQAGNNAGNITLSGNGITSSAATATITASGGAGLGANQAGGNAGQISITGTGTGAIALNTGAAITARTGNAIGTGAGGNAGSITINGPSITSTGALTTTGGANGNGGNVSVTTTSGNLSVGAITTTGGTATGIAGRNAGNVTINSAGAVTTAAITANGNAGNGTDQAGGNGGAIAITGIGGVTTTTLAASGGIASTTNGKGGDSGSIAINNSGSGNITTTTLTASTGAAKGTGVGGTAGSISVTNTAAGGNLTTSTVTTTGGAKGNGGNVSLSAQGVVSTANRNIITSGGAGIGSAGGNAGAITITGGGVNFGTGTITANGGTGNGTDQAGGNGGAVQITSTNGITANGAINATGGNGVAGNAAGGNGGSINIANSGAGAIQTAALIARNGAATGTGAGGSVGSIAVTNTAGNVTLGALTTSGQANGNGGNISASATGLLTLNGAIASSGGANVTGTTQAGRRAGNITLSGNGITSSAATATITANGGAGRGTNQAGGNAGQISITGTGTGAIALNTGAAITASTGAATGTGAGGSAGSITINGPSITSTGALTTTGGANGDGGNVSVTTTSGNLNVGAITTTGGAATGIAGRNAGNVTINSAGAVTTGAITANGGAGNGTNQAGGKGGNIMLDAGGATPVITIGGNLSAIGGDRTGTGAAGAGGNIVIADALNVGAANRTISSRGGSSGVGAGGNITLGGAIYDDGGVRNLTVTGGSGTVTLAGGPVNATLANNLDTLTVTASDGAGKIRVGSVNTVAAQSYDAGSGGIELNGNVVTLGSAGADTVTFSDPVTLTGNSSITTAGGSGDNIVVSQTVNGAYGLTLNAGAAGNVTTSAAIGGSTPLTSFSATGAAVTFGGPVTAGSIFAKSTSGNLTLNAGTVLTGTGTGSAIELVAGGVSSRFINNAGATALNASNAAGRFLVWSQNPANDTRGGLAYAFKQYNATYGLTPVADTSANNDGFLYTLAPTITAGLTGSVVKTYDGTTAATLAASNFTATGAVDGDTVSLSGTGSFDNKNAGTGKSVTASGIAANATNGAATVYGYQVSPTSLSAAIGTINQLALTGTEIAASSSTYGSALNPGAVSFGNVIAGDNVSSTASVNTGAMSNSNNAVAGSYTQTAGALSGSDAGNYSFAGFTTATSNYTINKLDITGAITASDKVYDSTTAATIASRSLSGTITGDSVSYTGGTATFADKNVGTGKTVTAIGLGLSGADAGNYTVNSTAGTTANITPAALAINAVSDSKTYDGSTASSAVVGTAGLQGGDSIGNLSQSYASKNVLGTNGSTLVVNSGYVINDGNGGANYIVTTRTAAGTINPATLVIAANDASRLFAMPNPPFSATYTGFVGGETVVVLGGALSFRTSAEGASPPGNYAITPYGQTSGNYAIVFRDGVLTVRGMSSGAGAGGASVAQQAIGAVYTSPPAPDLALSKISYVAEDAACANAGGTSGSGCGGDSSSVIGVVRLQGGGIRLPAL